MPESKQVSAQPTKSLRGHAIFLWSWSNARLTIEAQRWPLSRVHFADCSSRPPSMSSRRMTSSEPPLLLPLMEALIKHLRTDGLLLGSLWAVMALRDQLRRCLCRENCQPSKARKEWWMQSPKVLSLKRSHPSPPHWAHHLIKSWMLPLARNFDWQSLPQVFSLFLTLWKDTLASCSNEGRSLQLAV